MMIEPPNIGPGCIDLVRADMRLGFDTETFRFPQVHHKKARFTLRSAVRMVCSTWYGRDDVPPPLRDAERRGHAIIDKGSRAWRALVDRTATPDVARWAMAPKHNALILAHNAPFDLIELLHEIPDPTLWRDLFRMLALNRIGDTRIREKLLMISMDMDKYDPILNKKPTRYDLASCVERHFGHKVGGKDGEDVWRLRYHELDGVPLSRWPIAAKDYALMDAEWPLMVAARQAPIGSPRLSDDMQPVTTPQGGVIDESRQLRAFMALSLMQTWGVRTDPNTVATWRRQIEEDLEESYAGGYRLGFVRSEGKRKGSVDRKKLQSLIYEDLKRQGIDAWEPCPDCGDPIGRPSAQCPNHDEIISEPSKSFPEGQIRWAEAVLLRCKTPELRAWGEVSTIRTNKSRYLFPAWLGTWARVPYAYDPLKETGRTSSFSTNQQNPPRDGLYRECHVSRPGTVYCSADYSAAELSGLAQIHYWVFGTSALRDLINAGEDPHKYIGSFLAGVDYEVFKTWFDRDHPKFKIAKFIYRQCAKVANFGIPGGLGPDTFIEYALGYNVDLYVVAMQVGWNDLPPAGQRLLDLYGEREAEEAKLRKANELGLDLAITDHKRRLRKLNQTISDLEHPVRERYQIARSYAAHIIDLWREAIPEGKPYMNLINDGLSEGGGSMVFPQFVSGRQRKGSSYCSLCNTGFQGIVADGAKLAMWLLGVLCYVRPEHSTDLLLETAPEILPGLRTLADRWGMAPDEALRKAAVALFGVRPVMFIHDEIIAEGDENTAHVWAPWLARVMEIGMRVFIPDVECEAEPALMRRWYKGAEPVWEDATGKRVDRRSDGVAPLKLVPWEPREASGACCPDHEHLTDVV